MMVDFTENSCGACGACEGSVPQHTALPTAPAKPPSPPREHESNQAIPACSSHFTLPATDPALTESLTVGKALENTLSQGKYSTEEFRGKEKKKKEKNEAKCFLNSQEAITALQV